MLGIAEKFPSFSLKATVAIYLSTFPCLMLADVRHDLCEQLGILGANGTAQRAAYIVDPEGVIRFAYVTDGAVGRNPEEVLRVLDARQSDELCPYNWKQGEDTSQLA
jgi:alkyl hydroperoxide reductase subunit AhpC